MEEEREDPVSSNLMQICYGHLLFLLHTLFIPSFSEANSDKSNFAMMISNIIT